MKTKITLMLLAVCFVASCLAVGAGADGLTAATGGDGGNAQIASADCPAGGICLWYWGVNGSSGHYKYCGKCGATKDYENHGYITVNGVRYCGSCGYTPCSPYDDGHLVTAGSAPYCVYCGQKVM